MKAAAKSRERHRGESGRALRVLPGRAGGRQVRAPEPEIPGGELRFKLSLDLKVTPEPWLI